jgi:GNAT superfamily N-acetyltransferase
VTVGIDRSAVQLRVATIADLAAIRAILVGHNNDGPVVIADIIGPYVTYLISRGRTHVAVEDGIVVGFGAAVDTGRSIHLADLFVQADRLGHGIGRPLLDAVLGAAGPRTTFASDDPRALPLYVRAGMMPLWPSLYLQGPAARLPRPSRRLASEPASAADVSALEAAWTGHDRGADHQYWAGMPEADTFVIRDGADVVAFGHARVRQLVPTRVLDRLVLHPDADPVVTTLTAMARAGREGEVMTCLLGPHPALRPLLEAGIRIVDRDQFLASDPDLVDPTRLIPNPGML